jgi:chromatin segregation and condensation protein Rec8/ScpA/Scc1 (kleisin family)
VLLYSKALKGTRLEALMSILYRDVPLEIFIDRILNTLSEKKTTSLSELLGESPDRTTILGTFLALLQLAKGQKVTVRQEVEYGDIQVETVENPQVDAAELERAAFAAEMAKPAAPAEASLPPAAEPPPAV